VADTDSRLSALNAVLRVAVRHPNLLQPNAFEELAEAFAGFVRFQVMTVVLPETADQTRLHALSRGPSPPFASFGARLTASDGFRAEVFGAGKVYRCDDTGAGTSLERAAAASGLLSYLAVPVRGSGDRGVIAALVFAHDDAGGAAAAPADLLVEMVDAIGASLDRALQLSRERRLAMIIETSGDAMLAWDRDGLVTDLNGAALRLTGRGRDELLGAPIRELLGPLPERADPDPQGARMELSARGPDGVAVRRAVSATITAVEDDPLVAAHALLRDLSQVVAAERDAAERLARIHELEEQHRTLLDNAPLIIFRLDPRTEALVYLNRHAERLLGVPIDEALATPGFLRDAHADADGVMGFEDAVARAKLGAASLPYEARLRPRSGDAIPVRGSVYPLVSDRGAVVGIEGILADVSAENAARTRLVQLDRLSTLGTLAAGVAHEINNPAAFLLLGVGMLDRILRGPQVRMEGAAASNAADLLLPRDGRRTTDADRREPERRVRAEPDARPDHRARQRRPAPRGRAPGPHG
jgi:PAS domain S-box-containing protein